MQVKRDFSACSVSVGCIYKPRKTAKNHESLSTLTSSQKKGPVARLTLLARCWTNYES